MNHDSVAPHPNHDHTDLGGRNPGNYAFDSLNLYQPPAGAGPRESPPPGPPIGHHSPEVRPDQTPAAPEYRSPAAPDPGFVSRRQALATGGVILGILVVVAAVVYLMRLPGADGF